MTKISLVVCCSGNATWTRCRQPLFGFIAVLLLLSCSFNLYVSNHRLSWSWMRSWSANNTTTAHVDPNLYSVAYPHRYRFILDEPEQCRQQNPFLVIMIPVAPHNRIARSAIRKTWGRETTVLGKSVRHFFLLGQDNVQGESPIQYQLQLESQEHHDLVQGDFLDSYHNLTIKTMLMLEWLASRCPNASYGMKSDSDMFINVHSLIEKLPSAPPRTYMTGNVVRQAYVHRDPNSKWFMPDEEFPESEYPPYALGLSYVFSMDLPCRIIEASKHVKAVWLEDVYMGLCMRYLGIDLTDPPADFSFFTSLAFLQPKPHWNHVIAAMVESPQRLLDVWQIYNMDYMALIPTIHEYNKSSLQT